MIAYDSSGASQRNWNAKQLVRRSLLAVLGVRERVAAEQGVLFTFDDGPHPEVTPAVLDLLSKHGAKAIFFVVGNRIPLAPSLLARIIEEGHLIGNHTYLHPLDGIPGLKSYYRDVKECQSAIKSQIGIEPRVFRPPLGAISLGSLLAPRLIGLQTLLWSVDVGDWKIRNEADAIAAGERLGGIAKSGDVVLLHDDNRYVLPLLAAAMTKLQQRRLDVSNSFHNYQ